MVATQENVQLNNIIYSLKDELEHNQINNNNEIVIFYLHLGHRFFDLIASLGSIDISQSL